MANGMYYSYSNAEEEIGCVNCGDYPTLFLKYASEREGEENLTSAISEVDYEQLKQECWEGWVAKHGMKNSIPEDMLTYVFNYALTVPISLDK